MIRNIRRPQQPATNPSNLNDFPHDVLRQIVWRLPIRDSARTSILSPHWKTLWLSNPNWILTPYTVPCEGPNGFNKFEKAVCDIITHHNGSGIKNMKICHPNNDNSLTPATRVWMDQLASKHSLRKLEMNVGYPSPPPLALFSCQTLVDLKLTLHRVSLNVPDVVNLPNLKHMSLHGVYFSNSQEFRALMNGCRALEELKLEEFYLGEARMEMEINLPELKVFRFISRSNEFVFVSLSANKLEILEFHGMFLRFPDGYFFPEMKEVVCLEIDQWLGAYLRDKLHHNLRQHGLRMNNTLRALRETRSISLNEWCTEYLTTIADTLYLPYFPNLKQMEISLWSSTEGHMNIILYLVKRSPFLESITLRTIETYREDILISHARDEYPLLPNPELGIHNHLKHIKMMLFGCTYIEMKLVETFLASCPELEQFGIKFAYSVNQNVKTMVMEKVPTFPRLSPSAEITFGDYIVGTFGGSNLGF